MTSGTANQLNAVWGSSASNIYAVGVSGTILHYAGSGQDEGAQVAATVTPQSISVIISDGYPTSVDYGTVPLGAEGVPISYTPGTYSYLRVQNDGSAAENLLIKGADATCGTGMWILGASGADEYSHLWGEGQAPESYHLLSTEASILSSGVAGGATVDFNLRIRMPTSCTVWGQYSTTVSVLAVAAP
jgi:hypothetical protein